MSAKGIANALANRALQGELRLAYIAIGDCSGIPTITNVMEWANVSKSRAIEILEDLHKIGLLRTVGDFTWAPDLYDGWTPQERSPRRHPTKRMRDTVFGRDGMRCTYCGCTSGPFHIDHIIPHSRGGETAIDNLTVACKPCNLSKHAKSPDEWVRP